MKKRAILLILDGLGDRTSKTSLELAKTPNLDKLAKEGMTGMLSPLGKGVIPPSDKSHLVLFGYDLKKYYCGRGPMEALGAGIKLKKGDVAFRGNFATIKNGKIMDRRAGRIDTKIAKKLEKEISMKIEDVKVIFRSTVEHRGALVLRGKGLSANITDTDPHKTGVRVWKCKSRDGRKESRKTARIVNKFSELVFGKLSKNKINKKRKLPANVVLLRGAGGFRKIDSMKKRFGLKAACISGGALYKGVAKFVGMNILEVKGATGDKNTNLKAKGKAVLKALKKYNFIFLHVKATDSFSHDKDCNGKKKMIEKIDKELIPILIKSKAGLVISGDHSTPCKLGKHSADLVPVLVYGLGKDFVKRFDERNCRKGKLGKILGKDVITYILNLTMQK